MRAHNALNAEYRNLYCKCNSVMVCIVIFVKFLICVIRSYTCFREVVWESLLPSCSNARWITPVYWNDHGAGVLCNVAECIWLNVVLSRQSQLIALMSLARLWQGRWVWYWSMMTFNFTSLFMARQLASMFKAVRVETVLLIEVDRML